MMRVLFYHANGQPVTEQVYTSPGRSYFDHAEADVDDACNEGDVLKFHVGHGVYRTYTVEACDGKLALLRLHT